MILRHKSMSRCSKISLTFAGKNKKRYIYKSVFHLELLLHHQNYYIGKYFCINFLKKKNFFPFQIYMRFFSYFLFIIYHWRLFFGLICCSCYLGLLFLLINEFLEYLLKKKKQKRKRIPAFWVWMIEIFCVFSDIQPDILASVIILLLMGKKRFGF